MIDPETEVEDLKENTLLIIHSPIKKDGLAIFSNAAKEYYVEYVNVMFRETQVCILLKKITKGWLVFCCGKICIFQITNHVLHNYTHSIVEINV